MQVIDTIRTVQALSEEMTYLARQQDWDALITKERQRAALLATLSKELAVDGPDSPALAELIKKIQASDCEVREFVEPWLEHTQKLLARLSPNALRE